MLFVPAARHTALSTMGTIHELASLWQAEASIVYSVYSDYDTNSGHPVIAV